MQEESRDGFIELILETSGSKCTNLRDHLYALLPLASRITSDDWEGFPDYTLPLEEVFKDSRHGVSSQDAHFCILQQLQIWR